MSFSDDDLVVREPLVQKRWHRSSLVTFLNLDNRELSAVSIWDSYFLLVSGNPGTGKSSFLQRLICNVLENASPNDVRLLLIDATAVDLGPFRTAPHLLTSVVSDRQKISNALGWAVRETARRIELLVANECKTFDSLLTELSLKGEEVLPEIIIFIDDLEISGGSLSPDACESLYRILSNGRVVGVRIVMAASLGTLHLLPASVRDLFECRISFRTTSVQESRRTLGTPGAEMLEKPGHFALLRAGSGGVGRFAFAEVDMSAIRNIVQSWNHWASQGEHVPSSEKVATPNDQVSDDDDDEAMLKAATEIIVRSQLGSTSMLQRKLKVGFARAGRIMDLLEQRGVVGPSVGAKGREVLMSIEEFERLA